MSFRKWRMIAKTKPFVGFSNYITLMHDEAFLTSIRNTFVFVIGVVPVTIIIALFVAVLLENDKIKKYSGVYELIYFIPAVVGMVPVAVVWNWIYDPGNGILNQFLEIIGLPQPAWLVSFPLPSIMSVFVWKYIGFFMVIILVGLKNIPQTYYEAAEIDGAGSWNIFRHITLPLLRPILLFAIMVSSIQAFKVFNLVYVMTVGVQGSPGNIVRVLVYDIYEKGFRFYRMGLASAESVILFTIIFLISIAEYRIGRETE